MVLTLGLGGPAVLAPELGPAAGAAGGAHTHAVGVVGGQEGAGGAVLQQRGQDQHGVPPAVNHLGHTLRRGGEG